MSNFFTFSYFLALFSIFFEKKDINLIKNKAKSNKKNITKDEAEKILKEANTHSHSHEESDQKKKQSKPKEDQPKKTKSTTPKSQKTKKVSKK